MNEMDELRALFLRIHDSEATHVKSVPINIFMGGRPLREKLHRSSIPYRYKRVVTKVLCAVMTRRL